MSKPRLLFISNLFPDTREPYRGLDNATLLHQLSDRWDVATLAIRPVLPFARADWEPRGDDASLFPRFVAARYIPKIGHRVNHRLMAGSLRRHLKQMRGAFQVALSSWIFPDSCAVSLLSRELNFPFVSIAQGSDVHQYLEIPARRKIIADLLPRAGGIITRSAELGRLLQEAGLPKEKIHPIYNGIDLELFQPGDPRAVREELGLPVEGRIILFVGNFVAIKNPMTVLEAFDRVIEEEEFENVRLVLVGGGPLVDELSYRASRGRMSDRVLFAGRQPSSNIAKFMKAADLLCLPSENEGVPNVILEAFASGLPVVASNVGGIPEVHGEGPLGRLVPPRDVDALTDALKAVLSQLPDREAIRRHGETFTWKRATDAYHEILSRAAGGA